MFLSQSCSVFVSYDISAVTVLIRGSRELPCCTLCLHSKRTCIIPSSCVALSLDSHTAPADRPFGSVKRMCQAGHRVVFDSDGSYVLNNSTKEVNWFREENRNYMLDMWVIPASWLQEGTIRQNEGFYEASLANGHRRASPINSDGVDFEGRREAGQVADDQDKCRVPRSRDLAVIGFTSNSCDSSSTSLSSTSSSDTASEISEPRNEVTDDERDDDASADMCQPSNEEAPTRRPRNPLEPMPQEKETLGNLIHLLYRS